MGEDEAGVHSAAPGAFVDVFAGCGGLSLGLKRAGWRGLFAVEHDQFAFQTLEANFLQADSRYKYDWPHWLEKRPWSIQDLLAQHPDQLRGYRGTVDLLAGGPPCQGFSSAGRRKASDPRNALVARYLELVRLLEPRVVLIENVLGITYDFKTSAADAAEPINFSKALRRELSKDYKVCTTIVRASHFAIPQSRPRFLLIGVRRGASAASVRRTFLQCLRQARTLVLAHRAVPARVSARSALSDLEVTRNGTHPCPDSPGYEAIAYKGPRTDFQRAMRDGFDGPPSDTRLAKHRPEIASRFRQIIDECEVRDRRGVQLSKELREQFGLKKMATRVLHPERPAPTVTSMPDDLLHYSEPRTLTVRENARLQTFPDWFVFKGKYTTGGDRRRREVPRFTQVANAVPPLLGECLGQAIAEFAPAAA